MRCGVVAVGTELLLGQIVDTNSSWIGEQLALAGIDSLYQTKVGDNPERIAAVLRHALDRSDAVIVCGGLGPTQDDLTRDVIAEVMGVELETDPELAESPFIFPSESWIKEHKVQGFRALDAQEDADYSAMWAKVVGN